MVYNSCFRVYPHIRQSLTNSANVLRKPAGCSLTNSGNYSVTCRRNLIQKNGVTPQLTPQEVSVLLRQNEFNHEFTSGSVKSFDSNQLASNDPMEDTRSEAVCKLTSGLLFGVYDGHGGAACARVISKRILNYVAAALLPTPILKNYLDAKSKTPLLDNINDKGHLVEELKNLYDSSLNQYLEELVTKSRDNECVKKCLEEAFLKLDSDLSKEVLNNSKEGGEIFERTLSVALSGAVACVAHLDGQHLHVASAGDCNAVLGVMTDDSEWTAKKITKEHNTDNFEEVKRIWDEHPDERSTVLRRDRLLGELAPLRSLGDYRYKWSAETLSNMAVPWLGPKAIPQHYHTPPYLSGKPDVFYHRLQPKDKFLIIASDGIWDMLTPLQAVELVGEHMKGKVFFNPLKLPRKDIELGDINDLLLHRKESLKSKPKDRNAATHLIRHAIGGTEYGVEHARLQHLLTLPPDVSRMFRDDMTVTVLFFDTEFLRQCPT